MKKSTVRTIYDIVFEETEDKLTLHFYGNGFLYQMVRILAGTLIEVGEGKKNADETEKTHISGLAGPWANGSGTAAGPCLSAALPAVRHGT